LFGGYGYFYGPTVYRLPSRSPRLRLPARDTLNIPSRAGGLDWGYVNCLSLAHPEAFWRACYLASPSPVFFVQQVCRFFSIQPGQFHVTLVRDVSRQCRQPSPCLASSKIFLPISPSVIVPGMWYTFSFDILRNVPHPKVFFLRYSHGPPIPFSPFASYGQGLEKNARFLTLDFFFSSLYFSAPLLFPAFFDSENTDFLIMDKPFSALISPTLRKTRSYWS